MRKQDGIHQSGIQMVGQSSIQMAFEYRSITQHPKSFRSFDYRTSLIFRSPRQKMVLADQVWFSNGQLLKVRTKHIRPSVYRIRLVFEASLYLTSTQPGLSFHKHFAACPTFIFLVISFGFIKTNNFIFSRVQRETFYSANKPVLPTILKLVLTIKLL